MINAEEIEYELRTLGFECFDLEGMHFSLQVEIFSQADIVIGAHGAGLSNILFCRRGTAIIEFIPEGGNVRNFFWLLAEKVQLKYFFLRASTGTYDSSIAIDTRDLRTMMQHIFLHHGDL